MGCVNYRGKDPAYSAAIAGSSVDFSKKKGSKKKGQALLKRIQRSNG